MTFIQSVDLLLLDPVIRLLRSTIIKKNAAWLEARLSLAQMHSRSEQPVASSASSAAVSCAVIEIRRAQRVRVSSAADVAAWGNRAFQDILFRESKHYAKEWTDGRLECWMPMLLRTTGSMYVRADSSRREARVPLRLLRIRLIGDTRPYAGRVVPKTHRETPRPAIQIERTQFALSSRYKLKLISSTVVVYAIC